MVKIGNKYRNKHSGKTYVLASVDNYLLSLVNIETGSRLKSGQRISNPSDLLPSEWNQITAGQPEEYEGVFFDTATSGLPRVNIHMEECFVVETENSKVFTGSDKPGILDFMLKGYVLAPRFLISSDNMKTINNHNEVEHLRHMKAGDISMEDFARLHELMAAGNKNKSKKQQIIDDLDRIVKHNVHNEIPARNGQLVDKINSIILKIQEL